MLVRLTASIAKRALPRSTYDRLPLLDALSDRSSRRFDVKLDWSREVSPAGDQVSPFTAVEEQLGLKLQSGRAPQDVVVIDSISRPTPD